IPESIGVRRGQRSEEVEQGNPQAQERKAEGERSGRLVPESRRPEVEPASASAGRSGGRPGPQAVTGWKALAPQALLPYLPASSRKRSRAELQRAWNIQVAAHESHRIRRAFHPPAAPPPQMEEGPYGALRARRHLAAGYLA